MAGLAEFELRVLLGLLQCGRETFASAVHVELTQRTKRRVSLGAVYVTLDRLERKGLLQSVLGEPRPERGGRARRHYHLTPRGRAAVREECRAMQRLWQGLDIAEHDA